METSSIDAGPRFQVKRIMVKPGASLSLQMHHHRAEHWIVVSGTAEVTNGEEKILLSENQSTYIPLKVNMAGVIPVIFASSMLALPALVAQFATPSDGSAPPAWVTWISANLTRGDHWLYMAIYVALILFFTFFYVSITFNPVEVADNMKKYGGFIPGIRAGRPTAEYLNYVLTRITVPGAIYLALISLIPLIALRFMDSNAAANFPFGGTSILIIVGVGLETVKQIEAQLQQRHYEGFLR
jgi:preprotein translocase subunit SecY